MEQQPISPKWSDPWLQVILGNVLRIGVLTAAGVVFLGGIVYLARHGAQAPNYHVFHGEPSDLCSISGIIEEVIVGSSRGVIQLGLLLLIATPVMRVLLSVVGFFRQRDRIYTLVSLIVLLLLLYSLFGGRL